MIFFILGWFGNYFFFRGVLFRNEFFGLARKLDEPEINNTSIDKVIWKWFFFHEYSVGLKIDKPEINNVPIDQGNTLIASSLKLTSISIVCC